MRLLRCITRVHEAVICTAMLIASSGTLTKSVIAWSRWKTCAIISCHGPFLVVQKRRSFLRSEAKK